MNQLVTQALLERGAAAWSRGEFEQQLRAKGSGYHLHHRFNIRLNAGLCSPHQVRGWIANRFYYQCILPQKDAAILANCPDRASRRVWAQRIREQDGGALPEDDGGGLEAWVRLGEAAGIPAEQLWSLQHVVPAVRFAADAYLDFARRAPWREAVCSSLTEMFAPQMHQERLAGWPAHYPWLADTGLDYFRSRIVRSQRDVEHGLALTLGCFTTRAEQERALQILQFKLDILWAMLDGIEKAYPA